MNTFSISEAIGFGWNEFKNNWKFWLIVFFIFTGASTMSGNGYSSPNSNLDEVCDPTIPGATCTLEDKISANLGQTLGVSDQRNNFPTFLYIILLPYGFIALSGFIFLIVISFGVSLIFQMGYLHLTFDVARGKQAYYKTLLSDVSIKKAYRYLLVSFAYVLLVLVGFLLFIIPGIYFAVKYYFVTNFFVDKNTGVREAFRLSAQATKGIKLKVLGLFFVYMLVMLLGALVFLVGVVPAAITIALANAYIYVKLADNMVEGTQTQPELNSASTDLV